MPVFANEYNFMGSPIETFIPEIDVDNDKFKSDDGNMRIFSFPNHIEYSLEFKDMDLENLEKLKGDLEVYSKTITDLDKESKEMSDIIKVDMEKINQTISNMLKQSVESNTSSNESKVEMVETGNMNNPSRELSGTPEIMNLEDMEKNIEEVVNNALSGVVLAEDQKSLIQDNLKKEFKTRRPMFIDEVKKTRPTATTTDGEGEVTTNASSPVNMTDGEGDPRVARFTNYEGFDGSLNPSSLNAANNQMMNNVVQESESMLNVNLLLKSLLFACLFYILSHESTMKMARKVLGKMKPDMLNLVMLAVFAVLYYVISMFI